MIEVNNLSLNYGDQVVLDDITFSIKEGQITGILGPNGAGKSTIIKVLAGLVYPKNGTLILKNNIISFKDLKKNSGFLIDGPAYYPYLSAYQNLKLIKKINNYDLDLLDLLDLVGLANTKKKKVKHFSAGMKQRLAIAMAIMNSPDMLVLDEPFNGLDPNGFKELIDLLKSLNANGTTIMVSSHLLNELEQFADHFILIHKGKIPLSLSSSELQKQKKNVFFTFNRKLNLKSFEYLRNNGGQFLTDKKVMINLRSNDIAKIVSNLVQLQCIPINVETRTLLQEKYFEITS